MKYICSLKKDNDVIIQGDSCITNLTELYEALVDKNTTEIEMRKEFADAFFTYTALCDFVENSAALAPNVVITVDDKIYDSTLDAVRELQQFQNPDEFVYAVEYNPSRIISTIQTLCKSYLEAYEESTVANNKIASMLVQIDDQQKSLQYAKDDYEKLLQLHNETEARLHALVSRVNFKYEKTINPDEMFLCHENKYNSILYIKEVTRVHYTDTLIYYIEEIVKTLYSMPVRSVVIEPYYAYGRSKLYKHYVPHWNLKYKDVYSNNIFMAGFQPKVMRDVLQNASKINYLIILDRGGYVVPHVDSSNVTVVYTASDTKDLPEGVDPRRCITYSPETLNIPYIDEFNRHSLEDRIQMYSSMDVTKELINILEGINA